MKKKGYSSEDNTIVLQAKDIKFGNYEEILDNMKKEKQLIERKIEQFLERIVNTDSQILINTYERQIKQLEEQRIITEEKICNCGTTPDNFEKINRTATLSLPFSVLRDFSTPKSKMVEATGIEPATS